MSKSVLYALLACLCWGIAPIFEKLGLRQANPIWAIIIRSTLTSVFLLSFVAVQRAPVDLKNWSLSTWLAVLLGGIISVLLAQSFYFKALQGGQVGQIVPIVGAYPLVSAIMAFMLLGESITWTKLSGIVLVVAGIILLS